MQRSLVKRNYIKRNYRNVATFAVGASMSGLLAIAPLSPSLAISPEAVPNPRQTDGTWIADTADLLSRESEALLNQQISELEAQSGHEIAIVTVADTVSSPSPKAFATELFNTWGIGKDTADNGLLFLISEGDRRTEIEIGYGLESVLTDAQAGQILREVVTPMFRLGDYDAGIVQGTETIVSVLSGEASPHSLEQLMVAGSEVEIPPALIQQAYAELQQAKAAEALTAERRAKQRQKAWKMGGAITDFQACAEDSRQLQSS